MLADPNRAIVDYAGRHAGRGGAPLRWRLASMALGLCVASATAWLVCAVGPMWSRHSMEYEARYGFTAISMILWLIGLYGADGLARRMGGRSSYYRSVGLILVLALLLFISIVLYAWTFTVHHVGP